MNEFGKAFTKFASATARMTGRPLAFAICCLFVIVWAATGPVFGFSDTWQLVINTSTTIITFLMVFLIQNTQNRDSDALHAKLDELIRVSEAKNSFIGIENLPDKDLEAILEDCEKHSTRVRDEARAELQDRDTEKRRRPAAKPRRATTAHKPAAKTAAKPRRSRAN